MFYILKLPRRIDLGNSFREGLLKLSGICTFLYHVFIRIAALMKRLYSKRNSDNSSNVILLSAIMLTFNLITVFGIINFFFFKIDFVYNPDISARGIKVIILSLLTFSILAAVYWINKRISAENKIRLFRKVIQSTPNKFYSWVYLSLSMASILLIVFIYAT